MGSKSCSICMLICTSLSALITFIVFLLLKVDGEVDWQWYYVFIPVWASLLCYVGFMFQLFAELLNPRDNWFGAFLWLDVAGLSFIVFTVLLSIKIEDPEVINAHWASIFSPLWISVLMLLLVNRRWPEYKHKFHKISKKHFDDGFEVYADTLPINSVVGFGIFTILHVVCLEGYVSWSYYIRFIPFWYICAVWFMLLLSDFQVGIRETFVVRFVMGWAWLTVSLFLVLLALYMEREISKLTYVFIPIFCIPVVIILSVLVAIFFR